MSAAESDPDRAGANPEPAADDWLDAALRQYQAPLLRYALSLASGNLVAAQDLAQESFLRLCRADRRRLLPSPAAWLFTVCRNLARDRYRKDARMKALTAEVTMDVLSAPPPQDPEAATLLGEATSSLRDAVAALTPREQELVHLKFQGDLSYREISAITGLTVSNVGYLLHHALRRIRASMMEAPAPSARGARSA